MAKSDGAQAYQSPAQAGMPPTFPGTTGMGGGGYGNPGGYRDWQHGGNGGPIGGVGSFNGGATNCFGPSGQFTPPSAGPSPDLLATLGQMGMNNGGGGYLKPQVIRDRPEDYRPLFPSNGGYGGGPQFSFGAPISGPSMFGQQAPPSSPSNMGSKWGLQYQKTNGKTRKEFMATPAKQALGIKR